MDFDQWLTTDPDDILATHCDIHNEQRPCIHCRDEEADRQYDSRKH